MAADCCLLAEVCVEKDGYCESSCTEGKKEKKKSNVGPHDKLAHRATSGIRKRGVLRYVAVAVGYPDGRGEGQVEEKKVCGQACDMCERGAEGPATQLCVLGSAV